MYTTVNTSMKAIAIIYDLKNFTGKEKTYLIRKVYGYQDTSNHGRYKYSREGKLTPYIKEKWGKNVIIINKKDLAKTKKILDLHKIPYQTRNIELKT